MSSGWGRKRGFRWQLLDTVAEIHGTRELMRLKAARLVELEAREAQLRKILKDMEAANGSDAGAGS
jgi:hypothetical protein